MRLRVSSRVLTAMVLGALLSCAQPTEERRIQLGKLHQLHPGGHAQQRADGGEPARR